jgi:hypothetical protein
MNEYLAYVADILVQHTKMDLGQMGWGGVDWIGLAQNRDGVRALVNAVIKLRVL